MNRPLFAWSLFAVCLVATSSAVGWLTLSAWRSDRSRQQALLDSEIRNALWRMDSLAAPLLAIEVNRPSFAVPNTGTPLLAPKLIHGYVVRDANGLWTIRPHELAKAREPLPAGSPFITEDWKKKLGTAESVSGASAALAARDAPSTNVADDLIIWPDAAPGPGGQMVRNDAGGQEAQNRNQLVQQVQQFQQAAANARPADRENLGTSLSLGPLRPMWMGDELVLARQTPVAHRPDSPVLEICWLNWKEWESLLAAQLDGASTLLRMRPWENDAALSGERLLEDWRMVSLPIRVEPPSKRLSGSWPAPLIAVWGLLLVVALAFGWLMQQTLALSERRAAFVSAVTHELRTPLTTFRLYTEMLSDGVATDPEQRQTYFLTLHREANRLTHLVENVLAYARLEHGRSTARNETLTAGELVDRCRSRLEQRVAETPLALSFQISAAVRAAALTTNAMAVEQILFNLIDNSCKYARDATDPRITCEVQTDREHVSFRVADFGPGLSPAARATLFQPFQKSSSQAAESAPGVGLGLALSQRLARELRGSLRRVPNAPLGLCFELVLPLDKS